MLPPAAWPPAASLPAVSRPPPAARIRAGAPREALVVRTEAFLGWEKLGKVEKSGENGLKANCFPVLLRM